MPIKPETSDRLFKTIEQLYSVVRMAVIEKSVSDGDGMDLLKLVEDALDQARVARQSGAPILPALLAREQIAAVDSTHHR